MSEAVPISPRRVACGDLVVTGPTASGKERLALAVAMQIGGEIVSADSMKVYREMDIGTAKPSPAARRCDLKKGKNHERRIHVACQHIFISSECSAASTTAQAVADNYRDCRRVAGPAGSAGTDTGQHRAGHAAGLVHRQWLHPRQS